MIDDLSFLERNQKRIEKALSKALPPKDFSNITEAIHYSVLDGGKRIRPQLIYLVADSLNLDLKDETIDAMAASGELIHCYSLIHDDLPCMDNDKIRRGKPSTHIKFGEASAVLAGSSLLTLAFEIIAEKKYLLNPKMKNEIITSLANCSGHTGIAGGQELDLKFENKSKKLNCEEQLQIFLVIWTKKKNEIIDSIFFRRF